LTPPDPSVPPTAPRAAANDASSPARVVKRYSNRKLYDTVESRYVTLPQIAELVRRGEDVRIIDNNTKEDLTSVTLAQILYEEERRQSRALPLSALKELIHTSGEKLMTSLRDSPVGKFIPVKPGGGQETSADAPLAPPAPGDPAAGDVGAVQGKRLYGLYEQVDRRVREVLETINPASHVEKLQAEVRKLAQRIDDLESRSSIRSRKDD